MTLMTVPDNVTILLISENEEKKVVLYDAFRNGDALFYEIPNSVDEEFGEFPNLFSISDGYMRKEGEFISVPTRYCKHCHTRMYVEDIPYYGHGGYSHLAKYKCDCGTTFSNKTGWK